MANDVQVISASLQVDTGNSNANIKEVNKNLKEVKTSLKETGGAASTTGKDVEGATGHFSKLKDQMTALPGPLGQATSGVGTLNTAFKALLANPIGLVLAAIVAVLALLYKSFVNTFEGGQKVEQVFAGLKAAGQALFDNLDKIVKSFGKLFTGDIKGFIQDTKEIGEAAVGAAMKMADLTKEAQALKREQLQNDLEAAERAKKLAILREQSTDDSIPRAKRKAALLELKKESEENAKQDIDLAKRTAENTIAQNTLEKDGAKKNLEEIIKAKIDAKNVETENANELRRINKQITLADKQEIAERKAAAQQAAAEQKARRQELVEFTNKLTQLQQENELLAIKDAYSKEQKVLENKIANDKRANELAFKDKKITQEQFAQIEEAIDIQAGLQRAALTDKHNQEVAKKEADFQNELAAISNRIRLKGITDSREAEKVQLQIGYEEKLKEAITRYKDDQVKFLEVKNRIDAELKLDQDKLDEKNRKEDAKKKFELDEQKLKAVIDNKKGSDFDVKKAALDAEQALYQKSFDDKTLSELEYNNKVTELANKRMEIADLETAHKKAQTTEIAGTLSALADLVGKQTIAGKALGIATALINTYQGASEAIKQKSTLPSPFDVIAKIANVAAIIGTGLKTVKAITAVQVPGGGGGSAGSAAPTIGGSGGGGAPSPVAPIAQSTLIADSQINQITRGSRAYVIDSDVNNAQQRNARLERAARLGGG